MRIPIGYHLDIYLKTQARVPLSIPVGNHTLISGTTGTGKTTMLWLLLYQTIKVLSPYGLELSVCDYKNELYSLNKCKRYHSSFEAIVSEIDRFYDEFQQVVKSGEKGTAYHRLVIDEFFSFMSNMETNSKVDKTAKQTYQRISSELTTLLAMGRSVGFVVTVVVQQAGVKNFSSSADRENFGNKIALGTQSKISAEMVFDMVDLSKIDYQKTMRPGCGYVYVQGEAVRELVVPRLVDQKPLEAYVRNFLME